MKITKLLCIIGTRPEVIKMAPLIKVLKQQSWASTRVIATAQHRDMLDQTLKVFNLIPDEDLDLMRYNQPLPELTAHLITALDKVFTAEKPDVVIAQGDTSTVLVASLCSFYQNITFCHVEAGLRSHDIRSPFPEEMNRIVTDRLSSLHFAPTEIAKQYLLKEGINEQSIHVTGNTVIDALLDIANQNLPCKLPIDLTKRLILVTAHRRENFGTGILEICQAIRTIANTVDDVQVLFPVHPNPNVNSVVNRELSNQKNILLYHPLDYVDFISVMKHAYIILTDSGGIQEEAPALGKPVLILRNKTDRPEGILAGVTKLIGTSYDAIVSETLNLLNDSKAYQSMAKGATPYGDGKASERISQILKSTFNKG